jgi:hypothetical protein
MEMYCGKKLKKIMEHAPNHTTKEKTKVVHGTMRTVFKKC